MKVSGETTLHAPVEQVHKALHDPAVLVRTIPGCQRMEEVGTGAYRLTVTAGVAAVKGTFLGNVKLEDTDPPHAFVLKASGSGTPGTVSTEVAVRLAEAEPGTTVLSYAADADVGGPIGGVGQRLLTSVAHKTAMEFFNAVDALLVGGLPDEQAPAQAPGAPPRVFTRPAAAPATRAGIPVGFVAGAALGAGIALLGALVGGLIGSRAARRRG
jgi:carbon monoxide dehydrogenase subunit G